MRFRDFSKITKLEITFLIDIVAITGFLSVPGSSAHAILLIPLLLAGSLASMSASLFNNLYDRDIDPEMKRTSSRQNIIKEQNHWMYTTMALLMVIISSGISYYFINMLTMLFILGGFASYVFLYTILLKRRTTWNIVIGGIAGSFPALAGWSSLTGTISPTALFIAFIVFLWTPTHFWSLATGNVEDYRKAGVPMLPAVVGIRRGAFWIIVNTAILVAYSFLPLFLTGIHVGITYFVIATLMDIVLIYYVVKPISENFSMPSFKKAFHFSNFYLLFVLLSIWVVNYISLGGL